MLCQLKSGLYCYLVPTNYDGTDLMTKMWVEAVLPEGDIHYAEAVKEMYRKGVEEIRGGESEGSSPNPRPDEPNPRNVFTFDGAWQQVHSMFTDVSEELSVRGFEGYKFAAAATMM
jgi:hypothetical protein